MQSDRVKPSWFLTSPLLNSALVPTHSFPPCQQTTCLYCQPRSPSNNATSLLNSPMTLFPHRDKVQSPYGNHRGSPSPPRPAPSLILPLNQFSLLLLAHLVVIWKETQQATSSGPCPWNHMWLVGPIQCPRHTALLHSGLLRISFQEPCHANSTSANHAILSLAHLTPFPKAIINLCAHCHPHYTVSPTTVGLCWFCALLQSTGVSDRCRPHIYSTFWYISPLIII